MIVAPRQKAAADWIVKHELGEYNHDNQLVVQSIAVNFETELSDARRLQEPTDLTERSLWSLRRQLVSGGWLAAERGRRPSVAKRCFAERNTSPSYYVILLERDLAKQKLALRVRNCHCSLDGIRSLPLPRSGTSLEIRGGAELCALGVACVF